MSWYQGLTDTEVLFVVADMVWAVELNDEYGMEKSVYYRTQPQGRGKSGTILRVAYEAREKAYQALCDERGYEVPEDELQRLGTLKMIFR